MAINDNSSADSTDDLLVSAATDEDAAPPRRYGFGSWSRTRSNGSTTRSVSSSSSGWRPSVSRWPSTFSSESPYRRTSDALDSRVVSQPGCCLRTKSPPLQRSSSSDTSERERATTSGAVIWKTSVNRVGTSAPRWKSAATSWVGGIRNRIGASASSSSPDS